MADKKESFTVTDRRMFTSEGELRKDVTEETSKPEAMMPAAGSFMRQPPAGKSWTTVSGNGRTVSGSKITMSATIPGRSRPRS